MILEIGGPNIRPEIAHAGTLMADVRDRRKMLIALSFLVVMRLAAAKLPVTTEVIDCSTSPRVGSKSVEPKDLGPRVITKGQLDALRTATALEELSVQPPVAATASV